MFGRRNASKDIWRAVVMAGAMLGAGAGCGGSSGNGETTMPVENTTTDMTEVETEPVTDDMNNPCAGMVGGDNPCEPVEQNPCANPCEGMDEGTGDGWEEEANDERVRGSGDEGGVGRGFILA